MVLTLTILAYVSILTTLKQKTFNKSLTFIHLYKVLFHVLSFAHGWVIQMAQHLNTRGVVGAISPQVSTEGSKQVSYSEQDFFTHLTGQLW